MEGDAGTRQLNPTDADQTPDSSLAVSTETTTEEPATEPADHDPHQEAAEDGADPVAAEDERRPSRLGRGSLVALCLTLVLAAAGAGVGGYFAWKSHSQAEAFARDETVAVQAAKDCVAATHAPDAAAMTASQAKILDCSTGDFAVQAGLYGGMLVDAYRAANVQVQVADMRAAVEKHNPDGSIDVLVAVRVKVTNAEAADQEQGYRLRVLMAPADGTFKVARLDTVAS
jgi:Mce-associated membrane protein